MELTGQKWANIKQGPYIFGKTLISLRPLPFGVNVMLNLSNSIMFTAKGKRQAKICIGAKKKITLLDTRAFFCPSSADINGNFSKERGREREGGGERELEEEGGGEREREISRVK